MSDCYTAARRQEGGSEVGRGVVPQVGDGREGFIVLNDTGGGCSGVAPSKKSIQLVSEDCQAMMVAFRLRL